MFRVTFGEVSFRTFQTLFERDANFERGRSRLVNTSEQKLEELIMLLFCPA